MIHDHTIDLSRKFCPLSISALQKIPVIQHSHDTAMPNNSAISISCIPTVVRLKYTVFSIGSQPQGISSMGLGSFSHISYPAAKTPVTSVDMTGAPFTILNSKTYECPPYCSAMCLVISFQWSNTYFPIMGSYIFPRFRSIST
mgnify:CR=1 FL=1